jgi:hypothetical protein
MKKLLIVLSLICSFPLFAEEPKQLYDDALRSYLVGTWIGAEDKPGMLSQQTFRDDGTYEGLVVMKIKSPSGTEVERRLVFSGVWKVEGDVCIETTQKIDPQISKVGVPRRYRITEVTNSRHRSTNTETQASSAHLRKEAPSGSRE